MDDHIKEIKKNNNIYISWQGDSFKILINITNINPFTNT